MLIVCVDFKYLFPRYSYVINVKEYILKAVLVKKCESQINMGLGESSEQLIYPSNLVGGISPSSVDVYGVLSIVGVTMPVCVSDTCKNYSL